MARFVVEGGTPLRGEITPAGNKNEALPLIAASLLPDDPVTLHNLPRIRDVRNMLEIASALGANVEDLDPHTTRITAKDLRSDELPAALAREIRPSLLFAAPLLHRRKRARLGQPGGDISGVLTNTVVCYGVERLHGTDHTLLGDHMEIGSLIATVAMTHGEATIHGVVPEHLRMMRFVFGRLGIETEIRGNDVFIAARDRFEIQMDLGGAIPELKPQVWPGFRTDLTSMATVFATQAEGVVVIHEWMFEGRLYFVDTLTREMGARIVLADPHRAVVMGPSKLRAAEVRSPDIRAGMALLAAALCATGTSVINNVEQIDRGYEELDRKSVREG